MANREDRIHLRIRSDVKDELKVVAELRGTTVSGLVHQLIVRAIREEKMKDPNEFARILTFHRQQEDSDETLSNGLPDDAGESRLLSV